MTGAEPGRSDLIAPDVTVVVVNYNGSDYLRGCIASLAHQTHTNFETILIDNASTDGSLERVGETPDHFRVLKQDANLGFAAANNIGARAGRGKWLALLNPDAEAAPDWIEAMLRAVAERPDHRLVASLQIAMINDDVLDGAGDCYLAYGYAWRGGFGHAASEAPQAGTCFAPCGAAALYPRETFLTAGGLDERYFCYHEDVDLGFRLRLMGEKCQFVPTARVRHAGSAITGRASRFAVFHGMRNGVWTYLKNMPGLLLLPTLPVWLLGLAALLVRGLVKRQFNATLDGFTAAFRDLGPALAARREVKAKRIVSLGAIAAALTWNPLAYVGRQIDVRRFRD
jgi:N-acetylglucosaminyl-diphospho-decaprenol L-rhamnosyltransferase